MDAANAFYRVGSGCSDVYSAPMSHQEFHAFIGVADLGSLVADSIKMDNFLGHLVAIGLPSAMLYFFSIIPLRRVYRARAWLETPCVILCSTVEEDLSESGVYRILVTYNYAVAGRSYSSSRYDFSTGATCGSRGKKAVVDRLAPGMRVVCYVNPTDPSDSVIKRGFTWDMLFWGVFAVILLITFGFVGLI